MGIGCIRVDVTEIKEGDRVDFEPIYRERVDLMASAGDTDEFGPYGQAYSDLMAAEDHYFEVEKVDVEPCVEPGKETRTLVVIYTFDGSWAFDSTDTIPRLITA